MKKLIGLTLIILASTAFAKKEKEADIRKPSNLEQNLGTSQSVVETNNSWVRITGDSARALYNALEAPAKNTPSEAGTNVYFKTGQSYKCWMSTTANPENSDFVCSFIIKDIKKGLIK